LQKGGKELGWNKLELREFDYAEGVVQQRKRLKAKRGGLTKSEKPNIRLDSGLQSGGENFKARKEPFAARTTRARGGGDLG